MSVRTNDMGSQTKVFQQWRSVFQWINSCLNLFLGRRFTLLCLGCLATCQGSFLHTALDNRSQDLMLDC